MGGTNQMWACDGGGAGAATRASCLSTSAAFAQRPLPLSKTKRGGSPVRRRACPFPEAALSSTPPGQQSCCAHLGLGCALGSGPVLSSPLRPQAQIRVTQSPLSARTAGELGGSLFSLGTHSVAETSSVTTHGSSRGDSSTERRPAAPAAQHWAAEWRWQR